MNKIEESFRPFIINSPVEFVLIGPVFGRQQVIVQSKEAGIDLIGFSQEEEHKYSYNKFLFSIFSKSLTPQIVTSNPHFQPNIESRLRREEYDYRKSDYKFVWRGVRYGKFNSRIIEDFNLRLSDILIAVEGRDQGMVEWSIAPLITNCSASIIQKNRNRVTFIVAMSLYLLIILIALLITFYRKNIL